MKDLLLLITSLGCVCLAWYLVRLWVILTDLSDAIEHQTVYLQQTPSRIIQIFRINRLVSEYSTLLAETRKTKGLKETLHNQVEGMLGNIQEAVFSIDQNNTIIHSNKAACDTFNRGKPINGKRIEELIRNPEFLSCAHLAKQGIAHAKQAISIHIGEHTLWFEVSATPIPKSSTNPDGSVIFVFHNITRLKELEMVKNNFVANVSHELRTPITVIKGFTETLIDDADKMDSETRTHFLKKIDTNTERLNLIVQDLLTLSRIESEPDYLHKIPASIGAILEGISDNYSPLIKPGQSLKISNHAGEVSINMDPFKITQVIQNLVENSIRYSDENGHIEVVANIDTLQQALCCKVMDSGVGIPEVDIPNIFRRFYRVDKARTRASGGTGLGLSIARGIIQLHKGSISASNRPEGGLCVTFTIPIQ